MEILNERETIKYSGGGKLSLGIVTLIGAAVSFVLGIIDGITNPGICRAK